MPAWRLAGARRPLRGLEPPQGWLRTHIPISAAALSPHLFLPAHPFPFSRFPVCSAFRSNRELSHVSTGPSQMEASGSHPSQGRRRARSLSRIMASLPGSSSICGRREVGQGTWAAVRVSQRAQG